MNDLLNRLSKRLAKDCSSCSDAQSTDSLLELLEEARLEYASYKPIKKIIFLTLNPEQTDFSFPATELDSIINVAEIYVQDSSSMSYQNEDLSWIQGNLYQESGMRENSTGERLDATRPGFGENFFNSIYRKKFQTSVSFDYNYGNLVIYRSNLLNTLQVAIVYNVVPEWEQINLVDQNLLIKYAVAVAIEGKVSGINGITEIPTPLGGMKTDGGKVMNDLAKRYKQEFYDRLDIPVSIIRSG